MKIYTNVSLYKLNSFKVTDTYNNKSLPFFSGKKENTGDIVVLNTAKKAESSNETILLNNILKILGIKQTTRSTKDALNTIYQNLQVLNMQVCDMAETLNIVKPNMAQNSISNNLSEVQKNLGIDYKSGLYNAETLKKDIEKEKAVCEKEGKPFSFAMFDFDNFKSINDLLSYDIGDEFIKVSGKDIGEIAAKKGLKAYRFGGEEFMILLPGYTQEEAAELAQNVLNVVNNEYLTDKYIQQYIDNGRDIKKMFLDRQHSFQEVMEFVEGKKSLDSEENKNELKQKSIMLLEKTKEEVPTAEEKQAMHRYIKRIEQGELFTDIYKNDLKLQHALIAIYSGQDKISSIDKWISNVTVTNEYNQQKGFTMTSGVWQADDMTKSPDYYIHNVGEVLCYGKRHTKGSVYCKTPTYYSKYVPDNKI